MKKQFYILMALFGSFCSFGQNFNAGGINYSVTSATAPFTVKVDENPSYSGTATIPASVDNAGTTYAVTSIGSDAFFDCSGLTSVSIPNSVTDIGGWAFYNCSGLTSVGIPNSVASIGELVFYGCTGLTSASIPNSVSSIGEWAFSGCIGLTSINIPNSLTSIGELVFYNCSGLTSVSIPNSVTNIGVWAFLRCTGLTSVSIPSSVAGIGDGAFGACSSLTTVNIPASVTSISEGTFAACSSLTMVSIPSSVTSIGGAAFYDCSALTTVNIPSSVTTISEEAFSNCTGLTSVTVNWTTPLTITANVFQDVTLGNVALNVPAGTSALYDAALVWTDFNPITEPLSTNNFVSNTNYFYYSNRDDKLKLINNKTNISADYNIFDINGKLIQNGSTNSNEVDLNLDTKGVFIVVFESENWKQSLKFVR